MSSGLIVKLSLFIFAKSERCVWVELVSLAQPEEVGHAPVLREPHYHLIVNELRSQDGLLAYQNYLLLGGLGELLTFLLGSLLNSYRLVDFNLGLNVYNGIKLEGLVSWKSRWVLLLFLEKLAWGLPVVVDLFLVALALSGISH